MKILNKITLVQFLIGLLVITMFLNGCGRKESEDEGCPSGSYVANSTDILTGPSDASFVTAPCASANIYIYPPLLFSVTDAAKNPRNNVCLVLYTDGNWFADNTYSFPTVAGSGNYNRIVVVTDESGRSKSLYWGTELLPDANPVKSSGTGTAITYTAGDDQKGSSFVTVQSGVLQKTFKDDWTVTGCPVP